MVFYIPSQYKHAPLLAIRESNELKKNRIYVRRNASIEEATDKEITDIVNKRVEIRYAEYTTLSLNEHLDQLENLYSRLQKEKGSVFGTAANANKLYEQDQNESYETFIARLITMKKKKIEKVLEILDIDEE